MKPLSMPGKADKRAAALRENLKKRKAGASEPSRQNKQEQHNTNAKPENTSQ